MREQWRWPLERCSGTSQECRSANNGSGLWAKALALHRRIITDFRPLFGRTTSCSTHKGSRACFKPPKVCSLVPVSFLVIESGVIACTSKELTVGKTESALMSEMVSQAWEELFVRVLTKGAGPALSLQRYAVLCQYHVWLLNQVYCNWQIDCASETCLCDGFRNWLNLQIISCSDD